MRLHGPRSPTAPLLILALLVLLATPLRSARGSDWEAGRDGEHPGLAIERAVSELVLIETYVTDASGRPVSGLTPEDLVLMVDGRRRPIASLEFREMRPPGSVVAANAPAGYPATAHATDLPRRFMLFFEDGTSAPQGLTAARHAVDSLLSAGFGPTDQVGLASYDSGLRILHDFTADREALRRTVARSLMESRRVSDLALDMRARTDEIERLLAGVDQAALGDDGRGKSNPATLINPDQARVKESVAQSTQEQLNHARFLASAYASDEAPRLRAALRALRTLVDSLAGWGGYKAIVYMGDGIPDNPGGQYLERILAGHSDERLISRIQTYSLVAEFDLLARAAAAAGVTIHTLQTRGVVAGTGSEISTALRRANSLEAIAVATGGLTSSSNDVLKALAGFEASSRAYYILGYQPEDPPDGRYHPVQVRCRKDGVLVRSRRGFLRLRPGEARERTIQAAHSLPELYPQLPIGLSAVAGPSYRSERIIDLVVHVPGDKLLFLPEAGRPTAHLEFGLVAVDDATKRALRTSRRLHVALQAGPDRPGEIAINLVRRVRLPARAQSVTAVVYDDADGMVGAVRLALPAAAPVEESILGLSIYSLREKSLWIELPERDAAETTADPAREYTIGPALKAAYAQGEPLVCGFRMPARSEGVPSLRIVIRGGDRTIKTVAIDPVDALPGTKVHAPLPVEGFPPGEYTVAVQEILPSGAVDRGTAPLRILPADALVARWDGVLLR